jgi:preprotein translocase subunit SecD
MTLGSSLARIALVVIFATTLAACAGGTSSGSHSPSTGTSGGISAPSPKASQQPDSPLTMAELTEATLKPGQKCRPDRARHRLCAHDGKQAYTLNQESAHALVVRAAKAVRPSESKDWAVMITLDARSTKLLSRESSKLVGTDTKLGLIDGAGDLLVAATVSSPISVGQVQLSGNYTKTKAEALAESLS